MIKWGHGIEIFCLIGAAVSCTGHGTTVFMCGITLTWDSCVFHTFQSKRPSSTYASIHLMKIRPKALSPDCGKVGKHSCVFGFRSVVKMSPQPILIKNYENNSCVEKALIFFELHSKVAENLQIYLSSGNYFHHQSSTHTLFQFLTEWFDTQLGTALFFLSIIITHSRLWAME